MYTLFFVLWLNWFCIYPQAVSVVDGLKEKLPRVDRYKLTKSVVFKSKGDNIISYLKNFGKVAFINQDSDSSDFYYTNRIEASYCFRNANGFLFEVVDKNIKEFWKTFNGDKRTLRIVSSVEKMAYDSLIKADSLRGLAEGELSIGEKILLVSKAEQTEFKALLCLEKILYAYLNWPFEFNPAWLLSESTQLDYKKDVPSNVAVTVIETKASDVATGPLRMTGNEEGKFVEFAPKPLSPGILVPEKVLADLHSMVIDSVHRQWRTETDFKNIYADTAKVATFKLKRDVKSTMTNIVYNVQIAANKIRIGNAELKKIYHGPYPVTETYDGEWYRYTIGSFSSFDEAMACKKNISIKDAFVTAVINGKRFTPKIQNLSPE